MNGKTEILARIREALAVPSHPGVRALAGDGVRDAREARNFLPPGGETVEERLSIFLALAAKLKVETQVLPNAEAAAAVLARLRDEGDWARIASHHAALTDAFVPALGCPVLWTDDQPGGDELESCPVGITVCEALIAQTGSILVTSKGCGGRALSVLPPHHIVIATLDQLLPDLLAGYDLLRAKYREHLPSFISFITGASRTGDIERILVLGAHGPKRLTVLIIR
jgi:L-lactate dehydrogenase complex protein LldG